MRVAIRALLVALLLLTGAVDFVCFDLSDPYAPMSDAGAAAPACPIRGIGCNQSPASAQATPLLDDGCLGCGIGFAAKSGGAVITPAAGRSTPRYIRFELRRRGKAAHLPPKA
jgi:hypothetical protein